MRQLKTDVKNANAIQLANRLTGLMSHQGWADIAKIFEDMKAGAESDLLKGEWNDVLKARATIEVVDGFFNNIKLKIKDGEKALKKLENLKS